MAIVPRPFAAADVAVRTGAVLAVTAFAGVALLLVHATRRRRAPPREAVAWPAARAAYAYLVLALCTRFAVQQHRSRLQILVLLVVVSIVEAVRARPGHGARRGAAWLAGSAAVCLGVVMAKWALEPGALSDTVARLRIGRAE